MIDNTKKNLLLTSFRRCNDIKQVATIKNYKIAEYVTNKCTCVCPNIEALLLNTLEIVIKEYSSDPQSLVMYFKKRKSEDM